VYSSSINQSINSFNKSCQTQLKIVKILAMCTQYKIARKVESCKVLCSVTSSCLLSFTRYFPINETDIMNKLRCPRIFQALSANTVRFSFLPYCLNNYLSRVYLLRYTDLYAINILLVLYIILLYYFRDATKCGAGRICGAHHRWSVLIT